MPRGNALSRAVRRRSARIARPNSGGDAPAQGLGSSPITSRKPTMSFRVLGLSPDQFRPLFAMDDAQLHQLGARRVIADDPRMPCRVSMEHAQLGEELLLLNFEHQPANTPYSATHAIYVRKIA